MNKWWQTMLRRSELENHHVEGFLQTYEVSYSKRAACCRKVALNHVPVKCATLQVWPNRFSDTNRLNHWGPLDPHQIPRTLCGIAAHIWYIKTYVWISLVGSEHCSEQNVRNMFGTPSQIIMDYRYLDFWTHGNCRYGDFENSIFRKREV